MSDDPYAAFSDDEFKELNALLDSRRKANWDNIDRDVEWVRDKKPKARKAKKRLKAKAEKEQVTWH